MLLGAKLLKIEVWRLFHWKAECLLMKIGSFDVSRDQQYVLEIGLFEQKEKFKATSQGLLKAGEVLVRAGSSISHSAPMVSYQL